MTATTRLKMVACRKLDTTLSKLCAPLLATFFKLAATFDDEIFATVDILKKILECVCVTKAQKKKPSRHPDGDG